MREGVGVKKKVPYNDLEHRMIGSIHIGNAGCCIVIITVYNQWIILVMAAEISE